jgi:hypothetical protein
MTPMPTRPNAANVVVTDALTRIDLLCNTETQRLNILDFLGCERITT